MKKKEITISKTIKTPIPGVQFSNQVFSATITYEGEQFDLLEAVKELNKVLSEVRGGYSTDWIDQKPEEYRKQFKKGVNKNVPYSKKSKENGIKKELIVRFHEQERIKIEDTVGDYFTPKSPYSFILAKMKMRGIFHAVGRHFNKQGIPFGCVNEYHEHGIPFEKEEFEFMGITRYKLVKAIIIGSNLIVNAGVKRGAIKASRKQEAIEVPLLNKK